VTQKPGQISLIRPDQIQILCCSLRISGHLLAPVVNGRGDGPRIVQFSELQKTRDLDLGSGYMAYHCESVIDLYVHTKLNRKNFFMDRLTPETPPSSRSRDTKTKTNIKNPARSNLDIVL